MSPVKRLLHEQAIIAGVGAVIIVILTVISFGIQLVDHASTDNTVTQSNKQSHFWLTVAGVNPDTDPTPGNKLAHDLRALSNIDSFRGNSNAYGGVVDEIGFDPFDESGLNCFECGPLSATTKYKLAQVKSGNILGAIADLKVQATSTYHLTAFEMPVAAELAVLWLIGGPITLLIAHGVLMEEHYVRRFKDLLSPRTNELVLLACLNPLYMFPILASEQAVENQHKRMLERMFPEHLAVIHDVDRALDRLPDGDESAYLLKHERDQAYAELEQYARSTGPNSVKVERELLDSLGSVRENLRLREEAREELR